MISRISKLSFKQSDLKFSVGCPMRTRIRQWDDSLDVCVCKFRILAVDGCDKSLQRFRLTLLGQEFRDIASKVLSSRSCDETRGARSLHL
jgi:hypothetical protein